MVDYVQVLGNTRLFSGINPTDIKNMLGCFQPKEKTFKKGDFVYSSGERITSIGILAEGALLMQKDYYWGNRSIITNINVGEIFGGAYAMTPSEPILFDIVASENSAVLFFDVDRLLTLCTDSCACHARLIKNLIFSLSQRNRSLTQKIDFMAQRTIRDKLISYLTAQYMLKNSEEFDLPFNRQQLADYLSVDRSALSNELSKMRNEGMILYSKNHFTLLRK